jgi:hypothetical protein
MAQKPNRNDILRDMRYILAKHAVDTQKCLFSCSVDIATVYGVLKKSPRGDFSVHGVDALCRELKMLPGLRDVIFRFDNWQVAPNLTSIIHLEKNEAGATETDNSGQEQDSETNGQTSNDKRSIQDDVGFPGNDIFL